MNGLDSDGIAPVGNLLLWFGKNIHFDNMIPPTLTYSNYILVRSVLEWFQNAYSNVYIYHRTHLIGLVCLLDQARSIHMFQPVPKRLILNLLPPIALIQ